MRLTTAFLTLLGLLAARPAAARAQAAAPDTLVVRVNQLGYLPDAPKTAVACALRDRALGTFTVRDLAGHRVLGPRRAREAGAFGPCARTWRLDFSTLRRAGTYVVEAGGAVSPPVRIGGDVYRGTADSLLVYLRQQRSGWNPLFRDSVHARDGVVVDDPVAGGMRLAASGGWFDAADYLQYVATSGTATHQLLLAYEDHPAAFGDAFAANGLPGANGVPDVLDEARHGLEWLLRMFPEHVAGVPDDSLMLNQLADDRDHSYWDLPTTDSVDYGWGKAGARPLYPCTGRPQGLFAHRNRATGKASTAGKFAAAFAAGARAFAARDAAFADSLRRRAIAAYRVGLASPGACQTAPGRAPYFYEEDDWADDMELGAAELRRLTRDDAYLRDALRFAAEAPVKPWQGADTANHYQWYPWHDAGHYVAWRAASPTERARLAGYYRDGLARVARRADNGFRVGVPFIWCSNDLVASFATQALLYRRMTGVARFREYEAAALDWLFGANPWGTSMVIGLPGDGKWPRDPHSVIAKELGVRHTGALVDGPVYATIFGNLKGIVLRAPDEYAAFNTGRIVYHDDLGDYSTNEPITDGTANLAYLLSALGAPSPRPRR